MIYYLIQVEKQGIALNLKLNGFPIMQFPEADHAKQALPVNQWLLPEKNELLLHTQGDKSAASVEIRFTMVSARESPQAGEVLLRFYEEQENIPRQKLLPLPLQAVVPGNVWSEGETLTPEIIEEDQEKITELVKELQESFAHKQLDKFLQVFDYKAIDIGRSHYMSPEEARTSQRDFFESFLPNDQCQAQELDPQQVENKLIAHDLILQVSRENEEPLLQSSPSAPVRMILPVYLAKRKESGWTIAR